MERPVVLSDVPLLSGEVPWHYIPPYNSRHYIILVTEQHRQLLQPDGIVRGRVPVFYTLIIMWDLILSMFFVALICELYGIDMTFPADFMVSY